MLVSFASMPRFHNNLVYRESTGRWFLLKLVLVCEVQEDFTLAAAWKLNGIAHKICKWSWWGNSNADGSTQKAVAPVDAT